VITRALGTDQEVDVDTFAVEAESEDLFLLCSDGLTTMVDDEEIRDLVTRAGSLDQAAKGLVKAANKAGGEDNITVVLFRLAEGERDLEDTVVASGNGRGQDEDLEDTLTGLEAPRMAAAPAATAVAEREWGPALDEDEPVARPAPAAAFWALTRANFIGVEDDGQVAVYQGVPWDLAGGVHLYRARYVSQLKAVQLTPSERAVLLDHDLSSYDSARDRLDPYEQEASP
jgi:protein phosphatase